MFYRPLANNVFFYSSFDSIELSFCVPNSFCPDNENGPSLAHPEAINFAS